MVPRKPTRVDGEALKSEVTGVAEVSLGVNLATGYSLDSNFHPDVSFEGASVVVLVEVVALASDQRCQNMLPGIEFDKRL